MHLTETFASTVAVTIPVLALAAAVELRNLSEATAMQLVRVEEKTLPQIFELFVMAYDKEGKSPSQLRRLILLLSLSLRTIPPTFVVYALPLGWALALIYATTAEIINLVYLTGTSVGSAVPLVSVLSIGLLMLLLIATPIIQTLYIAPQTATEKLASRLDQELSIRVKRELGRARDFHLLPEDEKRRRLDRVKSIISDSRANITPVKRPSPGGHISKILYQQRRRPRWVTQRYMNRTSKSATPNQHRTGTGWPLDK